MALEAPQEIHTNLVVSRLTNKTRSGVGPAVPVVGIEVAAVQPQRRCWAERIEKMEKNPRVQPALMGGSMRRKSGGKRTSESTKPWLGKCGQGEENEKSKKEQPIKAPPWF